MPPSGHLANLLASAARCPREPPWRRQRTQASVPHRPRSGPVQKGRIRCDDHILASQPTPVHRVNQGPRWPAGRHPRGGAGGGRWRRRWPFSPHACMVLRGSSGLQRMTVPGGERRHAGRPHARRFTGQPRRTASRRWPHSPWLRGALGWPPLVRSPPPSPPDRPWGGWLGRAATRASGPRWHRPRRLRARDGRSFRALIPRRALASLPGCPASVLPRAPLSVTTPSGSEPR